MSNGIYVTAVPCAMGIQLKVKADFIQSGFNEYIHALKNHFDYAGNNKDMYFSEKDKAWFLASFTELRLRTFLVDNYAKWFDFLDWKGEIHGEKSPDKKSKATDNFADFDMGTDDEPEPDNGYSYSQDSSDFNDFVPLETTPEMSFVQSVFPESLDNAKRLEIIKKVYNIAVKIHHPDKGGNHDDFARLSESYRQLITNLQGKVD